MSETVLGVAEVSDRTGIPIDTLYVMSSQGKLPPPDQTVNDGRTKLWYVTTIDEWDAARPRRGGTG